MAEKKIIAVIGATGGQGGGQRHSHGAVRGAALGFITEALQADSTAREVRAMCSSP